MTKIYTLLPFLLLLAGCATSSLIKESQSYARLGEHFRAFQLLDEEIQRLTSLGRPIPPALSAEHTLSRKKYLVELARQQIFMEQEDKALAALTELQQSDPGNTEVETLRQRAIEKRAAREVSHGMDSLFKNDLEQALAHFVEAERTLPGYPPAVEGSERVREAVQKLTVKAQQQFLEAVRKMPEFRYIEVRWHSANAYGNDPTRDDADKLRVRANQELARAAYARGMECRSKDRFGAALMEFKAAKRLDDQLPEVDAAIQEMELEIKATTLTEKAAMWIRSGKFEEADASLKEAYELSKIARAGISDLMIDLRRQRGQRNYDAARDLEILGKKQEALAAFEALATDWPQGFADEQARIEAIRTDVTGAETEYAAGLAAEAAGEPKQALEHYRLAERYYPGFKDCKARIDRLRSELQGPAGS
jgi:tetratricopeptide (TPR) repeat protein